ncbi:MAG: Gfo/Idh/MocA family oxidoreductase [Candidatus Woesearchaeota archaeon]
MECNPIKIMIVGAGNAGWMQFSSIYRMKNEHLLRRVFQDTFQVTDEELENIEVTAVCDPVFKNLHDFSQRAQDNFPEYRKPEYFNDLSDMLASASPSDIDFVVASVPSGLHASVGLRVAESGFNFVSEKPIETTLKKAQSIIKACEQAGVGFYGICQNRLSPDMIRAFCLKESGALGDILAVSATIDWFRSQQYYDDGDWRGKWDLEGGGALINQGIHMLDALYLFSGPIAWVQAHGRTKAHCIEVEDYLTLFGVSKSDVDIDVRATTSEYGGDFNQLRVMGTKGTVVLDEYKINQRESMIMTDEGSQAILSEMLTSKNDFTGVSDPLAQPPYHAIQLFAIGREIRGNPLLTRDAPCLPVQLVDQHQANDVLKLIMAAYHSVECDGGKIFLDSIGDYKPSASLMPHILSQGYAFGGNAKK